MNIRNFGTLSRPPEGTVDTWRFLVWAAMYPVTNGVADSSLKLLNAFEIKIVKRMIQMYLDGKDPSPALIVDKSKGIDEVTELATIVGIVSGSTSSLGGLLTFSPGQNDIYTP